MATLKNGLLVRFGGMDIYNKTPFFQATEQQSAFQALLKTFLSRMPLFISGIKGVVVVSEGTVDTPDTTHLSLYFWCSPTQGVVITRASNGVFSVELVDATDYNAPGERALKVSQSQFDIAAREHLFPQALRLGSW